MISALDNFERKIKSIDELITPVYANTNEIRLLLDNVDQSLTLIDDVLHYYNLSEELTPIISAGPGGNLSDYVKSMGRLEESIKYFNNISAVTEQERANKLLENGKKQLLDESEKLIARYANPLMPQELIELCKSSMTSPVNDIHAMQSKWN